MVTAGIAEADPNVPAVPVFFNATIPVLLTDKISPDKVVLVATPPEFPTNTVPEAKLEVNLLLKMFQSPKVITPVVVEFAVFMLITPAATLIFAPACTIPFVTPVASW